MSTSTTIYLDGELDTTPDETFTQAKERIIENEERNLCEMVGYFGIVRHGSIYVETHEARCSLVYDQTGKLVRAVVNKRTMWEIA